MNKTYPFIVIGAGAAGLTIAVGLAKAGKQVLLVDNGNWGGDCTNFGCIPSKTLIAAAEELKHSDKKNELGKEVLKRVRDTVFRVRANEEPERLKEMGIETVAARAYFLSKKRLALQMDAIEIHVQADHFVIATGSSPVIPKIDGLAQTPYLTNETVFDLRYIPESLCVIGGGPIGCELSQAFARLGSRVTQVERHKQLLKKEEFEAADVIRTCFEKEGIELYLGSFPQKVIYTEGEFEITLPEKSIKTSHLLVAGGRSPNVSDLKLENAGVNYSPKGVLIDDYGRTNQKHIWAVGDVVGQEIFTHVAENRARTVFLSLILPFPLKLDKMQAVPRVTFTDPEVASFGPLEREAIAEYGESEIKTFTIPFTQNDRAITAGREEGFVKVISKKSSGQIIGATIVGPRAGEMLPELSLAAYCKIPLRKIGTLIHPYPTYNLAIRKAADLWMKEVFLPKLKRPLSFIPWKRYLPLSLIGILILTIYFTGIYKFLTFSELVKYHQALKDLQIAYPLLAPLVFIFLYMLVTLSSLPGGAFLSLLGGFLFPIPFSTLYVVIGATIGASCLFLAARTAFRDSLLKNSWGLIKKMESGLKENGWSYLLFLRLVPLFPFWLVNLAPALLGVSFWTYLWTTFIGIIPGALVFTLAGSGLSEIFKSGESFSLDLVFNTKVKIALIVLGLFALMPIFIKKLIHKRDDRGH